MESYKVIMLQPDKANTPDELLDQVDENDQVVGLVSKAEAHQRPEIIHREIRIILWNEEGKLLIQKRSAKKKIYPGVWAESCQGHVPCGMSYEEAAHKELVEELGFDTNLKYQGKTLIEYPNEKHFAAWFVGEYKGEKIIPEPEEVAEVKLVSKEELLKLKDEMIPFSWQMLQKFSVSPPP